MGRSRWPMTVALLALAAIAAGTVVASSAGWRQWWVGVPVGVLAAAAAAAARLVEDRLKVVSRRRADRRDTMAQGAATMSGRLRRVADFTDPIRLGVHPARRLAPAEATTTRAPGRTTAVPVSGRTAAQRTPGRTATQRTPSRTAAQQTSGRTETDRVPGSAAAERVPGYVPRDVDEELRDRLTRGGFVLLAGDSTAGKTRTAYEAMAAVLADHVLLAPDHRTAGAIGATLAEAAGTPRCVVWLDDLERYLSSAELTGTALGNLIGADAGHRVVLGTLRKAEYNRIVADDDALLSAGAAVLAQAQLIWLDRRFSDPELRRARARRDDPRIAAAVAATDRYGIAEHLAAGPDSWNDYTAAQDRNDPPGRTHPRGAALVAAAIDLRLAGYRSALPRVLLTETHEHYLRQAGGARLRPESVAAAWEWVDTPRHRTTVALLSPTDDPDDRVEVFDYLVDTVQRDAAPGRLVPEPVLRAALAECRPFDAGEIGSLCNEQGRYALAEAALRAAVDRYGTALGVDHPNTLACRHNLAYALARQGRHDEAAELHRAEWEASARVRGPEDPQTLISRSNLAGVLARQGDDAAAEAEHRAILAIRVRVLGPDHPDTLTSRHCIAAALNEQGRYAEAADEHRAVLGARIRQLGPDDRDTLASRGGLASTLAELGRFAEAEAEQRAVLDATARMLGPEHPDTLTNRGDLGTMLSEQERFGEALAEHRAVLDARARVLGDNHPDTLTSRDHVGLALANLGRTEEAEAEHRVALDGFLRVLGPTHPDTLTCRNNLALILSDQDRDAEAEAEHRAVLAASSRVLGPDHPSTLISRDNLAAALHAQGNTAAAVAELRAVVEARTRVLGADHPRTVDTRHRLDELATPPDPDPAAR